MRSARLRATAAVPLSRTAFTADARQRQIAEAVAVRREDPAERALQAWLDEAEGSDVARLTRAERHTPVTGATLVRMPDAEARRLEREVPGIVVLHDRTLPLIEPRRAGAPTAAPSEASLWHLRAIGLAGARAAGFAGRGAGITIALLDTGANAAHPELEGRIESAVMFDVDGWKAVPQEKSVDTEGHGTHVAGLLAGRRVGVAPGASLVSGIMLPEGRGRLSDFVLAIEWTAGRSDVQIANLSAGIPGFVEGMNAAIENLLAVGVLPVIATGNEGRSRTRSPGNYDAVLSIGAATEAGRVAPFSSSGTIVVGNHSYEVPDLVAPGAHVTSCIASGGYEAWDGTSMATPIVSGMAALALERWPDISPVDLTDALLHAAQALPDERPRQGAGLVQVPAALLPQKRAGKKGAKARPARPPRAPRRKRAG